MTSLDQLRVGHVGKVTAVQGSGGLVQRLLEMGLLEGEEVEVLGFAPFGDPMEIRLRDYRLSLRRQEAACISIQPLSSFQPPSPGERDPVPSP
jgi:ferrous iron transport protein A